MAGAASTEVEILTVNELLCSYDSPPLPLKAIIYNSHCLLSDINGPGNISLFQQLLKPEHSAGKIGRMMRYTLALVSIGADADYIGEDAPRADLSARRGIEQLMQIFANIGFILYGARGLSEAILFERLGPAAAILQNYFPDFKGETDLDHERAMILARRFEPQLATLLSIMDDRLEAADDESLALYPYDFFRARIYLELQIIQRDCFFGSRDKEISEIRQVMTRLDAQFKPAHSSIENFATLREAFAKSGVLYKAFNNERSSGILARNYVRLNGFFKRITNLVPSMAARSSTVLAPDILNELLGVAATPPPSLALG